MRSVFFILGLSAVVAISVGCRSSALDLFGPGTGGGLTTGEGGEGGIGTGGRGGATQFDPTGIADCQLWLRADLGVTAVGGDVSVWADQSAGLHYATQVSGNEQPRHHATYAAFNNQAAIECAPGRLMDVELDSGAPDDFTVFAVLDLPKTSGATWLIGGGEVDIAPLTNGGNQVGYYTATGWENVAPPVPGPQILTWRLDGMEGLGRVWRDGIEVGTPQAYTQGTMNETFILAGHTAFSLWCAEVIVYQRALPDPERVAVENYLQARYGL